VRQNCSNKLKNVQLKDFDPKLLERCEKNIFLEYHNTGYAVLEPIEQKLIVSCDVKFDETKNIADLEKLTKNESALVRKEPQLQNLMLQNENLGVFSISRRPNRDNLEDYVPKDFYQLESNPFADRWYEAINEELKSMEMLNVWKPVKKQKILKPLIQDGFLTLKWVKMGKLYLKPG